MSDQSADYVSITSAGSIAGIPERTLREWVRTGKLSAIAGKRGKLVNLEDVRSLAVLTGRQSADDRQVAGNNILPAGFAGNLADITTKLDQQTALISGLVVELADTRQEVAQLRAVVEALPDGIAGKVAELPALTESNQDAGSIPSEAGAVAPDESPVAEDQKRTGPFWRSWWESWKQRHP